MASRQFRRCGLRLAGTTSPEIAAASIAFLKQFDRAASSPTRVLQSWRGGVAGRNRHTRGEEVPGRVRCWHTNRSVNC